MAALLQVARNSQAETGKVERASLIQDYVNPALPDDWRERLGVFGQLDQDASDYQLEFTLQEYWQNNGSSCPLTQTSVSIQPSS